MILSNLKLNSNLQSTVNKQAAPKLVYNTILPSYCCWIIQLYVRPLILMSNLVIYRHPSDVYFQELPLGSMFLKNDPFSENFTENTETFGKSI